MGCAVLTGRMIQNAGPWVEGVEMVFVTPLPVAPGVLLVIDCPRMSDQGAQTLAHATVHWTGRLSAVIDGRQHLCGDSSGTQQNYS